MDVLEVLLDNGVDKNMKNDKNGNMIQGVADWNQKIPFPVLTLSYDCPLFGS